MVYSSRPNALSPKTLRCLRPRDHPSMPNEAPWNVQRLQSTRCVAVATGHRWNMLGPHDIGSGACLLGLLGLYGAVFVLVLFPRPRAVAGSSALVACRLQDVTNCRVSIGLFSGCCASSDAHDSRIHFFIVSISALVKPPESNGRRRSRSSLWTNGGCNTVFCQSK